MLQTIHEKTSGMFAKILLGIITIVFGGFFGTQQFGSSHSANYVADVDGHEITQQDFRERWDAYRQRITVFVDESIILGGRVTARSVENGRKLVTFNLSVHKPDGTFIVRDGSATIDLGPG